ncbi:hypothetical protein AX16_005606 [Volvariella volvacea WC 439]|nr:hypothetical protein AX16_005606 [Volvariella volvacea WC 439]
MSVSSTHTSGLPIKAPSASHNASGDMGLPKKFIGAVPDEWIMYSDNAADYEMGSPIGFGASSIVYAAKYSPRMPNGIRGESVPCALKVLDLDSLPLRSLQLLQRETTLMSLSKHPNVLRVRGSWMDGHKLYIALRLMRSGSAADVMRYGWPGGMEEDVVRCILCQALQGLKYVCFHFLASFTSQSQSLTLAPLSYLHVNGFIHRDVKAANLLIDDDGTVLLGDLGVAADLTEDTSFPSSAHSRPALSPPVFEIGRQESIKFAPYDGALPTPPHRPKIGKRKSFVGTPCWMAPELIQGRQYDSSADIWSFGITALELAQGRPPRSRESPQQVLLRIIQEDPPTLDRTGGTYKYSKAFKEMVEACLVKDPTKRPTAQELLESPFFKASKKKSYLVSAILKDLPPLSQRQERRPVHRTQTSRYLDSWDFATTVQSHHRRKLVQSMGSPVETETVIETNGDIFEMEGSSPSSPVQSTGQTSPIRVQSPRRTSDGPDHRVVSHQPTSRAENLALSTSMRSSDGSSSGRSLSTTPVSSSTSPSSLAESLLANATKGLKSSIPAPSHSSQSANTSGSTKIHQKDTSQSQHTTIRSTSGFWKKLKGTTQRPPSRAESLASTSSNATDISSSRELERVPSRREKIGQIFSSVGKKKGSFMR